MQHPHFNYIPTNFHILNTNLNETYEKYLQFFFVEK